MGKRTVRPRELRRLEDAIAAERRQRHALGRQLDELRTVVSELRAIVEGTAPLQKSCRRRLHVMEGANLGVTPDGGRYCRACKRERDRENRRRYRARQRTA